LYISTHRSRISVTEVTIDTTAH